MSKLWSEMKHAERTAYQRQRKCGAFAAPSRTYVWATEVTLEGRPNVGDRFTFAADFYRPDLEWGGAVEFEVEVTDVDGRLATVRILRCDERSQFSVGEVARFELRRPKCGFIIPECALANYCDP